MSVVLIELPTERRPASFLAGAVTFAVLMRFSLDVAGVEGGI